MTPTKIQAVRVALAIIAVAIFQHSFALGIASIALFVIAEALDGVDGYVARKRGMASAFGGIIDISTDQVIEAIYWFLFLALGLVPLWIPIFITVRGTLINLMRVRALETGKSAFGEGGMMQSAWGRALVASHVSRGLMVLVKVVGFCALQLAFLVAQFGAPAPLGFLGELRGPLESLGLGLCYALAAIHFVRGAFYVADGGALLRTFGWSPPSRDRSSAARSGASASDSSRPS